MSFKLVIARHDTTDTAPFIERLCQEPMISIGSDATATIQLGGIAAEQVVLLFEHRTPLLINRADGTRLNDELLIREAHRPFNPDDTLRFANYTLTLRPEATAGIVAASAVDAARFDSNAVNNQPMPAANLSALKSFSHRPESLASGDAVTAAQLRDANGSSAGSSPADAAVSLPSDGLKEDSLPTTAKPKKNFAAILDSLRTEEDSFYFRFETGAQAGERFVIDKAEMPCGWDSSGARLTTRADDIAAPRMTIRKGWTGVVIEAQAAGMVRVNDEVTTEARRLRNGDRVSLAPLAADAPHALFVVIVFNEPASLVAIDTLLPQPLPPPVAAPPATNDAEKNFIVAHSSAAAKPKKIARPKFNRHHRFFGYFTLLELGIMAISTIVAAFVVFLVLEYA